MSPKDGAGTCGNLRFVHNLLLKQFLKGFLFKVDSGKKKITRVKVQIDERLFSKTFLKHIA